MGLVARTPIATVLDAFAALPPPRSLALPRSSIHLFLKDRSSPSTGSEGLAFDATRERQVIELGSFGHHLLTGLGAAPPPLLVGCDADALADYYALEHGLTTRVALLEAVEEAGNGLMSTRTFQDRRGRTSWTMTKLAAYAARVTAAEPGAIVVFAWGELTRPVR